MRRNISTSHVLRAALSLSVCIPVLRAESQSVFDVSVNKSHTGNFVVGQNGTFTITVTNVGGVATLGATTLFDTLPAGLTLLNASGTDWTCTTGQTVSCAHTKLLQAGASATLTVVTDVGPAAVPRVVNTVRVFTPDEPVSLRANNTWSDTVIVTGPTAPDLSITKTHTGTFTVGQPGVFTLVARNVGTAPTTDSLILNDILPAGLSVRSAVGTGWTCPPGTTLRCTNPGPLAPGAASTPITLTVDVGPSAFPRVINTATVSTTNDANPANNTASDTVTVSAPDLSLTKTHTGTFTVGQPGVFTLVARNVGTAPTTDSLIITDVLPAGLSVKSAVGTGWTCPMGTPLRCTNPGPLAPNTPSTPITLTVDVGPSAVPRVINTATISTTNDANPANNAASDTVTVSAPDLSLTKTHTGTFAVGQPGVFTLVARNLGTAATTDSLIITDVLPAGLSVKSAVGTGWTCPTGTPLRCTNPGPLAPNTLSTPITLTVDVGASAVPQVINTATIRTLGDVDPTNNTATDTATVFGPPDLKIVKSAQGPFVVGSTGRFTIAVSNIGTGPTTDSVVVTDTLSAALTSVSAAGTGWNCVVAGQVVRCNSLAPIARNSAALPITIAATVTPAGADSVTNTAVVSTKGDPDLSNNTSTVVVLRPNPLDVAIEKTGDTLQTGANAKFTLIVTNVGTSPTALPITVTDNLPAGLTFVDASSSSGFFTCRPPAGQLVSCTRAAALAPGKADTITITVRVTAIPASVITNVANVVLIGDANPNNNRDSVTKTVGPPGADPDLEMSKSLIDSAVVGQTATFQLRIRNVGSGPTTGPITVTDTLPTSLSYVGAAGPTGWVCTPEGRVITCLSSGPMKPGDSTFINVRATVLQTAFSNTAVAKTKGDGNARNDVSTVDYNLLFVDILLRMEAAAPTFFVGQSTSYTLIVKNIGTTQTTKTTTVTDVLPLGLTLGVASGNRWSCTSSGQTLSCTLPAGLLAGDSTIITVPVTPTAAAMPAVRNTATASNADDTNPANDQDAIVRSVTGTNELSLTKASVGTFRVGGQGKYTLTVRSAGTIDAAPPLVVRDTLPSGLSFVSAVGTGWTCGASGAAVTCTRSTALAASTTSAIDLTVNVGDLARPSVFNCASVTGTGTPATATANRACVTTPVEGDPKLELTKITSKTEAQVGDVVDYTIVVRNTGTADLADALVVDDLPVGFAYVPRSVRLGGQSIAEPNGAPGPRLTFAIGLVKERGAAKLSYRVRLTAVARRGNNTNVAVARSRDGKTESGQGRASTRVTGGLFDERGAIVGKVYARCDCPSAMQDTGEVGIPGVRIYLEDGSSVITDSEGKYNFYNVASRLHVVKVDRTTLPEGATLTTSGNRSAFDGYTRFADVKAGELHKADFVEASQSVAVTKLVLMRRAAGEVDAATMRPDSATVPVRADQHYRPLLGRATLNDGNSALPPTAVRALAVQQGRQLPGPGRVQLDVSAQGVPADGQTPVTVVVRVLGADGNLLPGRTWATIETSIGRWLGSDMGSTERGRQVTLEGGQGTYTLVAPSQPGQGEVQVTTNEGRATVPITFVPAPRPFLAAGLFNARLDLSSLVAGRSAGAGTGDAFEESLRDWTFEKDSGKTQGAARGALLLKGRVMGNQLLTLSYDSERDQGRTHFRDIRPDEFFPVYGDASLREFDAQSRRRFYGRLDRGTSFTMFGDFQTTRADDRRVLTAYDRTLNGGVQHFEGRYGAATLFASQGRSRQMVDELRGRGISGPYDLSSPSGLVNSERVEIVTRDRNQPTVILSRMVLTRFADYTIEPLTGRLLMRAPVPSADANLNPVSIRVTYETESATGDRFWVYGGNASVRLGSALELGGTYAQDENPLLNSRLAGVNGTVRFGTNTFLLGELARTESGDVTGDAYRVELRHQSQRLDGRLFAASSDSAFSNQSSTFNGGRTELGGRLSAALGGKTRLIGEAMRTENNTGRDGRRDGALIALEQQLHKALRVELGYRYAKESGEYSPYPGADLSRINRGVVDNDVSALRGRLHVSLPERTRSSLFAEYEKDLRDDSYRGALGGEYIIANGARVYGRHEWLTSLQGAYATNQAADQEYTVFGVDANYLANTQMFSEYRLRDAMAGRDAEASIGLRNKWAITPGLLINTSFERVSPLATGSNSGGGALGEAVAVAGAFSWTRPEKWKTTARLEFRDADSGDNVLASFGYAQKLSQSWTLLGRTLWDVAELQQDVTRGWSQAGLAWRQTERNKWNALVRYENRVARVASSPTTEKTESMAHIVAGLANYQPVQRFTLSGRYATKVSKEQIGTINTTTTSQLLMGRAILDLNRRLDAGVITSLLGSDGFATRRYGLGGELGLIVVKNLRLAGGYNVFGFTDKDLDTFGTTRKGAYFELGFKFDESLFGLGTAGGGAR